MNYNSEIYNCGKIIFDYLYLKEEPVKADAVIGFGHFDLKIPRRCAELYIRGYVSRIIFTGGVGAGSADFKHPEAIEFFNLLQREYPGIPSDDIIIETESTNTGENLQFTNLVLHRRDPGFTFTRGIQKILKVSNAYRQRRAFLTCRKLYPGIEFVNTPAETDFEREVSLYRDKGQDLFRHLSGETERMIRYPALGFIASTPLPDEILESHKILSAVAPKYN